MPKEEATPRRLAPSQSLSCKSMYSLDVMDGQLIPCGLPVASVLSSCVFSKSPRRAARLEVKKRKLRQLLGDSVDLDIVPQLSCDADGMVVFDDDSAGW